MNVLIVDSVNEPILSNVRSSWVYRTRFQYKCYPANGSARCLEPPFGCSLFIAILTYSLVSRLRSSEWVISIDLTPIVASLSGRMVSSS